MPPAVCKARNWRNSPKRAMMKPKPMTVSPVRTQASSVRSAAKKTLGSKSDIGMRGRRLLVDEGAFNHVVARMAHVALLESALFQHRLGILQHGRTAAQHEPVRLEI